MSEGKKRRLNSRPCVCGQELYEKSLVRVEDDCLPDDLLELQTFLRVPQVNTLAPQRTPGAPLVWPSFIHSFFCCFQNLVKVMTLCQNPELVSVKKSNLKKEKKN